MAFRSMAERTHVGSCEPKSEPEQRHAAHVMCAPRESVAARRACGPSDVHGPAAELHVVEEREGERADLLVAELDEGELARAVELHLDHGRRRGVLVTRDGLQRHREELLEHLRRHRARRQVANVELARLAVHLGRGGAGALARDVELLQQLWWRLQRRHRNRRDDVPVRMTDLRPRQSWQRLPPREFHAGEEHRGFTEFLVAELDEGVRAAAAQLYVEDGRAQLRFEALARCEHLTQQPEKGASINKR
eukprot:6195544-Pleurochrysis_carterae.AAC.1